MNYIAPRKMTVSSTSGRSQTFEKNVPTFAPPQMHAELIALGIVPEDDIEEDEGPKGPAEPIIPHEREAALFKVFEAMVLRGKREEFTGVGVPHLAPLASALGWSAAKERDAAWTKFQQERATV
jgi:hypothetical protein